MTVSVITAKLYSVLLGRTSTFALTITTGALFFEHAYDQGPDAIYEQINQGKLWKHIKHKYENSNFLRLPSRVEKDQAHPSAVFPELGTQLEDDA